jgi:RluA family pseudouridine synthase
MTPLRILYEDDHLVAVDKPADLPTVPTADPGRPSLVRLLERQLRLPAGRSLGVHQRLDRDTTGVVLFAKSAEANPGLAAQFEAGAVRKTYLALVPRPKSTLRKSWQIDAPLARVGRGRMGVAARGGLPARTRFRLVREWRNLLLVEAEPATGRTHQVRVHLASCGLPVLGDAIYGTHSPSTTRGLLHAARLELRHPVLGTPLRIEAPVPSDFGAAIADAGARSESRSRPKRRRRGL